MPQATAKGKDRRAARERHRARARLGQGLPIIRHRMGMAVARLLVAMAGPARVAAMAPLAAMVGSREPFRLGVSPPAATTCRPWCLAAVAVAGASTSVAIRS